jgi:hypothetical protein
MSICIVPFNADAGEPIREFASSLASALPLAHGSGESHAYAVHIGAGGQIGPHPAGFDQLFLVVQGSGWAAGADGVRHALPAFHGAFVPKGEFHSKGSESGLVAIMVQAQSFDLPTTPSTARPALGSGDTDA